MLDEVLIRLAPIVEEVGIRLDPRFGTYSLYNNHGLVRSSVVTFVLTPGDRFPRIVVKLSRQREFIRREHAALERLFSVVPGRVPRP